MPPNPSTDSSAPTRSLPRADDSSLDSGTRRRVPATTAILSGMLMPNAHRHEYEVVSQPPSSGPSAAVPPIVEPHTAKAIARSRPGTRRSAATAR